jgi:hypothetical protein
LNNFISIPIDGFRKGARAFALNDELYVLCGITQSDVRLKSVFKYTQINTLYQNDGKDKLLYIYPNPTTDDIEIKFNEKIIKHTKISLINLHGDIVFENNIPLHTNSYHLNLMGISAGLYVINILSQDNLYIEKISIIK